MIGKYETRVGVWRARVEYYRVGWVVQRGEREIVVGGRKKGEGREFEHRRLFFIGQSSLDSIYAAGSRSKVSPDKSRQSTHDPELGGSSSTD